jgi:hypothetical protein
MRPTVLLVAGFTVQAVATAIDNKKTVLTAGKFNR